MITLVVDKIEKDTIEITDKNDINHLKNVFRKNVGDKIRLVDGSFEYFSTIESIENKKLILKIIDKKNNFENSDVSIDAAISILKNEKMDMVIQKLTEIGIKKIIPVFTSRTIVKLDKKKEKWNLIMKEALQQCQGISFTEIDATKNLFDIKFEDYDIIIVPYECEEKIKINSFIANKKEIKKILYIIGPEGGFTVEEINLLKEKNAKIITLGKRILRAETAAIVTGGILINEFY